MGKGDIVDRPVIDIMQFLQLLEDLMILRVAISDNSGIEKLGLPPAIFLQEAPRP
jgi:hypothetical protein